MSIEPSTSETLSPTEKQRTHANRAQMNVYVYEYVVRDSKTIRFLGKTLQKTTARFSRFCGFDDCTLLFCEYTKRTARVFHK